MNLPQNYQTHFDEATAFRTELTAVRAHLNASHEGTPDVITRLIADLDVYNRWSEKHQNAITAALITSASTDKMASSAA